MQNFTAFAKRGSYALKHLLVEQNIRFFMRMSACLIALWLTAAQLLWAAPGSAQSIEEASITLELKNESLKDALSRVEYLSGFHLAYPTEQVVKYKNISLSKNRRTVSETLELLLNNTGLGFKQSGNNIVIFKEEEAAELFEKAALDFSLQDIIIKGKVEDSFGDPLPGVSVAVKGTKITSVTDAEGNYSIAVPDRNAVLVFTYIGYLTVEREVGTNNIINAAMTGSANSLEEVVVVGYGTQKKSHLSGAVTTLSME